MKDPDKIIARAEAGEIKWEEAIADLEREVRADPADVDITAAPIEDQKTIDLALELARIFQVDPITTFGLRPEDVKR
jgi:hypothetical protein